MVLELFFFFFQVYCTSECLTACMTELCLCRVCRAGEGSRAVGRDGWELTFVIEPSSSAQAADTLNPEPSLLLLNLPLTFVICALS